MIPGAQGCDASIDQHRDILAELPIEVRMLQRIRAARDRDLLVAELRELGGHLQRIVPAAGGHVLAEDADLRLHAFPRHTAGIGTGESDSRAVPQPLRGLSQ